MDPFYPLQFLADRLTYDVFRLASGTLLADAVDFFLFDTAKILILLCLIVFVVSFVRSYLPPEKVRFALVRKNAFVGNVLAAALGTVTPFCSCSAIPLFLGFVQVGVPLGVTFSFLVASPMVNEVAFVLLLGTFGWKVAALYMASGFTIAVLSGVVLGKLKVEGLLEPLARTDAAAAAVDLPGMALRSRLRDAAGYTSDLIRKIWPYVLVGVGVGAWIHGYVPADFLASYAGGDRWYAVPLAVLVGIPLYSNAAGVVPMVSALAEKGVAMGTTLAFMMSVTALSLPEFMILRKVMRPRLIAIYAATVGSGIVMTGLAFNALLSGR